MRSQTMWSPIGIGAVSGLAVMLLSSQPVAAQSTTVEHPEGDGSDYTAMWVGATAGQAGDFDVIAASPGLEAAVKNAPYSAEAVSEMVQTLGDGTRIVRTSTSSVSRDWTGRTRREHGLAVIGPLANSPDADRQIITISDPEAGVSYMLDPQTRTARKMTSNRLVVSGDRVLTKPDESHVVQPLQVESRSVVASPEGRRIVLRTRLEESDPATESLGTQVIEGVLAEGTRTTMTIPTNQIGNDRPIQVVSERWYSPDLQVLVMSRQSDPRFGETTYRLTNIVLSDPASTLFEVPPDFEIIEGPGTVYRELRVQ